MLRLCVCRMLLVGTVVLVAVSFAANIGAADKPPRDQQGSTDKKTGKKGVGEEKVFAGPVRYRAHRRPNDTIWVDQNPSANPDDVFSYPLTVNAQMPLIDIEFILTLLWPDGVVKNDQNWVVERTGAGTASYNFVVRRSTDPGNTPICGPYAKLQNVVNKKVLSTMSTPTGTCPLP